MSLLNDSDAAKVAKAVLAAEQNTAGELVTMIVPRSDDYAKQRSVAALIVSLIAAQEAHFLFPDVAFPYLLVFLAGATVLFYWMLSAAAFIRLLVSPSRRSEQVMQRALQAFAAEGVTNTRDRSGVLIFLSEAEHRVVILADQGINERVEPGEWQQDVDALVSAIKQGRVADGLLETVARIGQILAKSFPPSPDDENELSNEVRRG